MQLRTDWRASFALVGTVLKYLSIPLVIPIVVALIYDDPTFPFVATIALTIAVGHSLERLRPEPDLRIREAMLFVSISWLAVAIVGSVPYVLAGWGTESTLANPVNALFESMSGFTTTGATVLGEISLERHSHAVMMWRQLTQWLGGMGIIVLMIAILPEIAVSGAHLIESEAPGPELQKLTPRIAETARILWLVYFVFTAVYIALLYGFHLMGLAPNMGLYNAIAHGFTTLPTGGFSPEADSVAAFSAIVQWTAVPFMIIAGTNFALFWHIFSGESHRFVRNSEFRAYIAAIAGLTVLLAGMLYTGVAPALPGLGGVTEGVPENSLRQSTFQIVSLLTSTGYATSDFVEWTSTGKIVLLFAMLVGGSAGSTGGGVKVIRWLIIFKFLRRELFTASHPELVQPIRLGGNVVDEDAIRGVLGFTLMYLFIFAIATLLIALDSSRIGYTLTPLEAFSASLATIGNIGPGFGSLGPFGSYLAFPDTSKLVMIFLMWIGRLEIIPVLVLFTGDFWTR
ncbi:TrkH family potassium uptake protein [Natronorubrum thiooxidans]|uniref:Trk system potassium uptake protein TrkH n=1 Tax=Natronorubrum thiooxidans TaxID=308853 RepID=A0A1N7GT37_9EURY|nr:TrkH family potassium uptake protein [Natronorubrum thiooxidans]SIS15714.1 trk system potassium uptake protein TrkH [Natronorubrum thiooxidans]